MKLPAVIMAVLVTLRGGEGSPGYGTYGYGGPGNYGVGGYGSASAQSVQDSGYCTCTCYPNNNVVPPFTSTMVPAVAPAVAPAVSDMAQSSTPAPVSLCLSEHCTAGGT